jgi:hypothetical protein
MRSVPRLYKKSIVCDFGSCKPVIRAWSSTEFSRIQRRLEAVIRQGLVKTNYEEESYKLFAQMKWKRNAFMRYFPISVDTLTEPFLSIFLLVCFPNEAELLQGRY